MGRPFLAGLYRTAALAVAWLVVLAPNLDVHQAQQVRASFGGEPTVIAEGASHPTAPLHVESSPQTEEEPCAFCLFSGQIGSGLLGSPIPQPVAEIRHRDFGGTDSAPHSAPLSGLPSRAPPAA